ncbi:alpha-E domain-containing protein, partial [bacterium]
MMLARVADSLYWCGRYIERAENVARLLMMTSDFCVELDGLDEGLAQAEWNGVLRALQGPKAPQIPYSPENGMSLPFFRALLTNGLNPASVRHSVERARDNARSVGEALTREVYTSLNALGQELQRLDAEGMNDPASGHEAVNAIHLRILTLLGAIEHTLTRDAGWTYLKLGEAMERAQRTATILRLRLPALLIGDEHDPTLQYALARERVLDRAEEREDAEMDRVHRLVAARGVV